MSNNTVSKRIDDFENKLLNSLRENNFAQQIDELTMTNYKAARILLAYMKLNESKEIAEKLLFDKSLITNTRGSSIF